jgi:hypothetical protein
MTDLPLGITLSGERVKVLRLSGKLDGQTEGLFVDAARRAKDSGSQFLLVDLGGVEMITSAGLRALHKGFKLFTPNEEVEAWQKENPDGLFKSPYFKMAGASQNVYYVLNLAGFLHNIPIYPDVEAALASFET